jgi:tyrosyl-tRNA synthetase
MDAPNDMFGKVMSIADDTIISYLVHATRVSVEDIEGMEREMKNETLNPRDAKIKLAREIVNIYHGEEAAREAEAYFVSTFSKHEVPSDIREVRLSREMSLLDFLVQEGFATSKGDARRKVEQGGVEIDGVKILDRDFVLTQTGKSAIVKCGKKDFVRVVF